ncbi:MAG: hypothetical protein OXI63_01605 [Candidatus Poribacteria bacterium]|nr:hypothetical protein [Candidatus Poribacteria bacterium]
MLIETWNGKERMLTDISGKSLVIVEEDGFTWLCCRSADMPIAKNGLPIQQQRIHQFEEGTSVDEAWNILEVFLEELEAGKNFFTFLY